MSQSPAFETQILDKACAIIVAAGQGIRARTNLAKHRVPKQFADLAGRPVLTWTTEALAQHPAIRALIIVLPRDQAGDEALRTDLLHLLPDGAELRLVAGGRSRRESVFCGLQAYQDIGGPQRYPLVLVHDGARPFVTVDLSERIMGTLAKHAGAIPMLPITDTLKAIDGAELNNGPNRSLLATVQTPQGFQGKVLLEAHYGVHTAMEANDSSLPEFTDDASILAWYGTPCVGVEGTESNIKITRPTDWGRADAIIATKGVAVDANADQRAWEVRTGQGYDVHQLVPGDGVWLCGHFIAHDHTLSGHSDADVGLHALTDAVLGTIAAGDIGTHFPPTDPQWKGAASHIFLRHAVQLVAERGGHITNVDVTLVAESPKIGPHRDAMVATMSDILGITPDRVSVKATTNETMGFVGRQEGIAAMAMATVMLKMGED